MASHETSVSLWVSAGYYDVIDVKCRAPKEETYQKTALFAISLEMNQVLPDPVLIYRNQCRRQVADP